MNDLGFIGKNGFVWWVGEVVDRVDPLGIGRCKVRIFGWHGDGTEESFEKIPETDLPWAQAIYPLNGRNKFGAPRIGDWVLGFFLDGEAAQAPCMLGVFSGFNNITTGVGSSTQIG
jgi:hypothetical protein